MTKAEAIKLIRGQAEIFEVARLVNVSRAAQFVPNEDNTDLIETKYDCYAVWNMKHRCTNCISAKAFAEKTKLTKFEFVDNDVYHIVAKYIEVEDKPFVLELVTKITDNVLFGAYGKEDFVDTINSYNKKLYIDPLTKAYNRAYFDEQLKNLDSINGVAMMDLDHFKGINDTFGHDGGDEGLRQVAAAAMRSVRDSDSVIRFGGDEFLILFSNITQKVLAERLEEIRSTVESIIVTEYPKMKLTVSIGGYYHDGSEPVTIKDADRMLYRAKEKRNCVVVGP